MWGKLGDELYVNGVADERDPNYDSDTTVSQVDVTSSIEMVWQSFSSCGYTLRVFP